MALEEMGVVVVAAAQEPGEGAWPAGSPTVLSVGSHPNAAPRQLYRDSTGARLFAAGHPRMAEGAPGGANFSGASFAAPRVAAMAACLKQSHPTLSAAALRARIMDLAVERPS